MEQNVCTVKLEHCQCLNLSDLAQINEDMKAYDNQNEEEEDDERKKAKTENASFLECLEELCSDEDFVKNVSDQWH